MCRGASIARNDIDASRNSGGASANFYFGGTSILIVVGVALDTMKQLEAQLMMRNYEGFLK